MADDAGFEDFEDAISDAGSALEAASRALPGAGDGSVSGRSARSARSRRSGGSRKSTASKRSRSPSKSSKSAKKGRHRLGVETKRAVRQAFSAEGFNSLTASKSGLKVVGSRRCGQVLGKIGKLFKGSVVRMPQRDGAAGKAFTRDHGFRYQAACTQVVDWLTANALFDSIPAALASVMPPTKRTISSTEMALAIAMCVKPQFATHWTAANRYNRAQARVLGAAAAKKNDSMTKSLDKAAVVVNKKGEVKLAKVDVTLNGGGMPEGDIGHVTDLNHPLWNLSYLNTIAHYNDQAAPTSADVLAGGAHTRRGGGSANATLNRVTTEKILRAAIAKSGNVRITPRALALLGDFATSIPAVAAYGACKNLRNTSKLSTVNAAAIEAAARAYLA